MSIIISNFVSVTFLTLLTFFILFLAFFFVWNSERVNEPDFKARYGELYSDLNLEGSKAHRKAVLLSPFIFVLKRGLFALTCVMLMDHLSLQVQLFSISTIFATIYFMIVKPNQEALVNRLDVLNEIASMLVLYHVLVFTDWVPDPSVRYLFGWSLIGSASCVIGIHLFFMLRQIVKNFCEVLKKKVHVKAKKK